MKKIKSNLFLFILITLTLVSCKKISSNYFTSGQSLYSEGKYEQALLKYNKAIEFDDSKKNHEYRGYVYCALEKYELAIEDFNIALALNTCYDPESFMRRGICYFYLGNYKAAIMDYHEAIERKCKHKDYVFFLLGGAQKNLSDYVGAIRSFDEALKINNRSFEYYISKGSAEYDYKDYESAVNTFSSSLLADNPDKGKAFLFMGNCNFRREEYSKAIYAYTLSIVDNISDKEALGVAYLNRGLCYINKQSYEYACADFSKSLECGIDKAQELINKYCNQKFTDSKPITHNIHFECSNCNEINFRNPEFGYYDNYMQVLSSISVINNTNDKLFIINVKYRCLDSSGNETDSGTHEFGVTMHPFISSKSVKRESVGIKFPTGGKIIFEVDSYKVWPCPTDDPC